MKQHKNKEKGAEDDHIDEVRRLISTTYSVGNMVQSTDSGPAAQQ